MKHPRDILAPKTWKPARSVAARLFQQLEGFLHIEAASGIVLLAAALAALVWANSPWASSYERIWRAPVTVGIGRIVLTESVHFWINDGLMVIFFFVVGLEIRREIHSGALADARRASLPIAGALGGMLVPAIVYVALNPASPCRRGWGIPMATDIAFAIGVLALLGKRIPPALRVLLLALAIIDDLGAIVVIAIFYSSGFSVLGLALAAAGTSTVLILQRLRVRRPLVYILPGAAIWLGMLRAGIHPTIAGVLLGLLTPPRPMFGESRFLSSAKRAIEEFRGHARRNDHRPQDFIGPLGRIHHAAREAVSPAVRLEAMLHGWVAYGIMPLFALANAGLDVRGLSLGEPGSKSVVLAILFGLVLGKPLGVVLGSFAAVRLGISALPAGVNWKSILVVGSVAGIGFTMAIFIAELAFPNSPFIDAAKLGVLLASLSAALIGLLLGRTVLPLSPPLSGAAGSAGEASPIR